jgi:hypothetical protein
VFFPALCSLTNLGFGPAQLFRSLAGWLHFDGAVTFYCGLQPRLQPTSGDAAF